MNKTNKFKVTITTLSLSICVLFSLPNVQGYIKLGFDFGHLGKIIVGDVEEFQIWWHSNRDIDKFVIGEIQTPDL